jgi:AcrR family transcriptional regulator
MDLADLSLAIERRLNAMEQQKLTINELAKRLTDELQRIGYSTGTIYRNFIPSAK